MQVQRAVASRRDDSSADTPVAAIPDGSTGVLDGSAMGPCLAAGVHAVQFRPPRRDARPSAGCVPGALSSSTVRCSRLRARTLGK